VASKTQRLNLRVSPTDGELFRQAAELSGQSLSEYLVESGRERAERALADRSRFVLDQNEWQEFTDGLERPADVRPELADLLSRPRPE